MLETKHYFLNLETRNMHRQKHPCMGSLHRWLLRNISFNKRWKEDKNSWVTTKLCSQLSKQSTYRLPGWPFSTDCWALSSSDAVPAVGSLGALERGRDTSGTPLWTLLSFPAGVGMLLSHRNNCMSEFISPSGWICLVKSSSLYFFGREELAPGRWATGPRNRVWLHWVYAE